MFTIGKKQQQIFDAVSTFKKTENPADLRVIDAELDKSAKAIKFSKTITVDGAKLAETINNFYIDQGYGDRFLETKSLDEVATFRHGLMKIMLTYGGSKEGLTKTLSTTNTVANNMMKAEARPQASSSSSSSSSRRSAPAVAARLQTSSRPAPTSKGNGYGQLVDMAVGLAAKAGYVGLSERAMKGITIAAKSTSEALKQTQGEADRQLIIDKFEAQTMQIIRIATSQ